MVTALAILTGDIKIQLNYKNIFYVIMNIISTLSTGVCAVKLELLISGGESLHKSKYSECKITNNEADDRAK